MFEEQKPGLSKPHKTKSAKGGLLLSLTFFKGYSFTKFLAVLLKLNLSGNEFLIFTRPVDLFGFLVYESYETIL
jgi:hypothetical protein